MNRGVRLSRTWFCPAALVLAGLWLACGPNIDLGGGGDAGVDAGGCPSFAEPDASAPCRACMPSDTCQLQPNGCFGGYLCDSVEQDCKPPNTPCSSDSGPDGSHP